LIRSMNKGPSPGTGEGPQFRRTIDSEYE
jgi:hypothetical protein